MATIKVPGGIPIPENTPVMTNTDALKAALARGANPANPTTPYPMANPQRAPRQYSSSGGYYTTPNGRTGSTFTPTGGVIRDTPNPRIEDSTGHFPTARSRQPGQLDHVSGYTGNAYMDAKGRYYTDYGALLREDGYFYPTGARVSENGMYYDTGNGWQFAGHGASVGGQGNNAFVSNRYAGAPGQRVDLDFQRGGGGSGFTRTSGGDGSTPLLPPQIIPPGTTLGELTEEQKRRINELARSNYY